MSTLEITAPGVYLDVPLADYVADPIPGRSLSSSGARKLLLPSCPKKFRHWQLTPEKPKRHLEIGGAAHKVVLGEGPDLAVIDVDDWRTKAAQAQLKAAREAGKIPVKRSEYDDLRGMAEELARHEWAGALFDPDRGGRAEITVVWQDPQTGVWCRARFDWLPELVPGRRLVIPDYKTTTDANPEKLRRTVYDFLYHQQDAWYRAAARAAGLGEDPTFAFVFQEKTPPYVITVIELDVVAVRIGAIRNRQALDLYARCVEADRWPGYSDGIVLTSLPSFAEREYEDLL